MSYPPTVKGPHFQPTEFTGLGDALDFAYLMGHDIQCSGSMDLCDIDNFDANEPFYRVVCRVCGDTELVTPAVYYRYQGYWTPAPQC